MDMLYQRIALLGEKFDLVHITPDTSPELIQNIEKDGVILYEKSC